jgi:hypothetical protein
MQLTLRGNGERNPFDSSIPLDRSSADWEHRLGRAPAGRSNQAKIGQEDRAVQSKTSSHQ